MNTQTMTTQTMTTDKLLELYHWAQDRAAYRKACGMPWSAADLPAEYAALAELERREVIPC